MAGTQHLAARQYTNGRSILYSERTPAILPPYRSLCQSQGTGNQTLKQICLPRCRQEKARRRDKDLISTYSVQEQHDSAKTVRLPFGAVQEGSKERADQR